MILIPLADMPNYLIYKMIDVIKTEQTLQYLFHIFETYPYHLEPWEAVFANDQSRSRIQSIISSSFLLNHE
jgi:hypothetical protein